MHTIPIVLALCLPVLTAPAAGDLARLQGVWALTSETFSGEPVPPLPFHAVIERDTLTFYREGALVGCFEVVIDEQASPKGILMNEPVAGGLILPKCAGSSGWRGHSK